MMEANWIVIRGMCGTPGAEDRPTYGVQCVYAGGVWTWSDVDTDPVAAQMLADRLNALCPEPCHFADMVLDFIEERAGMDL